jgi:formylglycine-generating enzyme required for sulfatase activity
MTTAGKEADTTTHQVFISYASENIDSITSDRQVADQICSALESQGIRCWIAHRNILPGNEWLNAIIDAVDQSKIIVLVFSAITEQSQWVKDEITLALNRKIKIIPFRLENVSPQQSLRILDVRCQWMDAFSPPLKKHIENLVKIVSRHLGKELAAPIKKENLKESLDMPEDVKKVISKAHKVEKNTNGYWEAYYQDGIVMVYIPPGEFMMGQKGEEMKWLIGHIGEKTYYSYYINETPLHKVYLEGYWLGKYEVTFAQYDLYCNENKTEKPDDEGWGRENRPVIYVSWDDAAAYCEWLSQKTGLKFILPTEAQWEEAACGNDQRKYPWGSKEPYIGLANFNRNIGKTTPVGSYPEGASSYGLLDMAGNVWELCSDWYEAGYYKDSYQKNPQHIMVLRSHPETNENYCHRKHRGHRALLTHLFSWQLDR